ncbi:MAG: beta-ketoacyl-ACP synthase III [Bryobacteraceae bacterium]
MPRAEITALGCFVPPDVLTNEDLSRMVETNDRWIVERTGIRERHVAPPDMATSDMAVEAAKIALAQRGLVASDLDAIIVCTVTPDMFFPSTACLVQDRLGASGVWGFDLVAACSGFVYGLTTAAGLIMSGTHKRVMVIGADTMTRILDYTDRATCILFGDGAGAMIVEATEREDTGFIGHLNEIEGIGGQYLNMPAGGSRLPASTQTVEDRQHFVKQEGQQVFKYAVRKMYEICDCLLKKNRLTADDIKLLSPHQANKRIIQASAERLGLSDDQVVLNIEKYGNTTAATIPLATRDALDAGRLEEGDIVLFAAVGAGYTAGANLWRWAY